MESSYQVISRRYRPQTFKEVEGQEAIITTLQNALLTKRLSHAYLFSGPRGTGKTTIARLLAKALNCLSPKDSFEPCNTCAQCLEIMEGRSLDVQEIDAASYRGIDHIRMITDGTSYSPTSGQWKIYLIDEVHMLTKEAFNALLKTLEEPPPTVKFFLATTEPHKIPATIISRCQHFHLKRLSTSQIVHRLQRIAQDLHIDVEETALYLIARYADGGLRDGESLLDQAITFSDSHIQTSLLEEMLGLVPFSYFERLDTAIQNMHLQTAFEISDSLFHDGKDIGHFLDDLCTHFRTLLALQLHSTSIAVSQEELTYYQQKASLLPQELILSILDLLSEGQRSLKTAASQRFLLETLLLNIIRAARSLSLPVVIKKLFELQESLSSSSTAALPTTAPQTPITPVKTVTTQAPTTPIQTAPPQPAPPRKEISVPQKEPIIPQETIRSSVVATPKPLPPRNHTSAQTEEQQGIQQASLVQFTAIELGASVTHHQS